MAFTNLQDSASWLLIRASMVAKQRLMKQAERHELSIMQALTLCLLKPEQTVPMSSISDLLTCDPSNVTGIVERLTVGGYIERRESSADRRVKTVSLTEGGVVLRQELLLNITENDAINLANLTDEEALLLKKLLLKTLPAPTSSKH